MKIPEARRVARSPKTYGAIVAAGSLAALATFLGVGRYAGAEPLPQACPVDHVGTPIDSDTQHVVAGLEAGEQELTLDIQAALQKNGIYRRPVWSVPVGFLDNSLFNRAAADFYTIHGGNYDLRSNKLHSAGSVACQSGLELQETAATDKAIQDLSGLNISVRTDLGTAEQLNGPNVAPSNTVLPDEMV